MSSDWIRDAVVYQIYPQSFSDSDADGIGDLRGVISRLDHVASLGVDSRNGDQRGHGYPRGLQRDPSVPQPAPTAARR